jgi:hypothetical protein
VAGDNGSVTRRTLIAVLACACVLAGPAYALARAVAVPTATATYLLGPKMIRAEIALRAADGTTQDFRVDRGRLTKRFAAGTLTLSESFGATPIKVSPSARVLLNGVPTTVRSLRTGMQVAVPRSNDGPADTVYASSTKTAPKLPRAIVTSLFSGRLLRAEIGFKDTALHDYLLDRGRIKQINGPTITLRESDGSFVTVSTAPTVRVKINGKPAPYAGLRRGMMATTMHDGDKPADQIWATGK